MDMNIQLQIYWSCRPWPGEYRNGERNKYFNMGDALFCRSPYRIRTKKTNTLLYNFSSSFMKVYNYFKTVGYLYKKKLTIFNFRVYSVYVLKQIE